MSAVRVVDVAQFALGVDFGDAAESVNEEHFPFFVNDNARSGMSQRNRFCCAELHRNPKDHENLFFHVVPRNLC